MTLTVAGLIEELKHCDPKAAVYTYDAEWDIAIEVTVVTDLDPRANQRKERLPNSVFIGSSLLR